MRHVVPPSAEHGIENLRTVARSADVLEFVVERGAVTLKEVRIGLGLGATVAYRILQTWSSLHYLTYDRRRRVYHAGAKLLAMGLSVRSAFDDANVHARVNRVRNELGLDAKIGVRDGRSVVVVASCRRTPSLAADRVVLPVRTTSLGRLLLAYETDAVAEELCAGCDDNLQADLRAIRAVGYAVAACLVDASRATCAVPLRDANGRIVAAITVCGRRSEFQARAVRDRILPKLLAIAAAPIALPSLVTGFRADDRR